MTEERAVLRLNLISGLLDDIAYNVSRKNQNLAFYEIGRVFQQENDPKHDLPQEEKHLALALTGEMLTKDWQTASVKVDFFSVKGILENVFAKFGVAEQITYEKSNLKDLHPGRSAAIFLGEEQIGFIGQVHPKVAKAYDLPETYVAEVNLAALLAAQVAPLVYQTVSKFPAVKRDIALLVADTVTNRELMTVIKDSAGKYLTDITLFDVYQGQNIEDGHKSMAYSLTFVNPEATLTDETINKAMEKVTKALTEKLNAVIR